MASDRSLLVAIFGIFLEIANFGGGQMELRRRI